MRLFLSCVVLFGVVFVSFSDCMSRRHIFLDTFTNESGNLRPCFRWDDTMEIVNEEESLQLCEKSNLPATAAELDIYRNTYNSLHENRLKLTGHFCDLYEGVINEVCFSCMKGSSPEYIFPKFRGYVALMTSEVHEEFKRFIVSDFFNGTLQHLVGYVKHMRKISGLSTEDLFLNLLVDEFNDLRLTVDPNHKLCQTFSLE